MPIINRSSDRKFPPCSRGDVSVLALSVLTVISIFIVVSVYGVLLVDDGYYYLQIAKNLSQGNGPTFDGINYTNGFHPLWQFALVPVLFIIRNLETAAVAATVLQTVFFAGAGFLLYRIILEVSSREWPGKVAALFFLLNFWLWSKGAVSGMETGILLFCFSMTLLMFSRLIQNKSGAVPLTVFLLLTIAARLDSLALAAGICLFLLLVRRYRDFFYVAVPSAAYLAVYMLVNRLYFGRFFPVSGYIKSASGTGLLKNFLASGNMEFLNHGSGNLTAFVTLAGRIPLPVAVVAIVAFLFILALFIKKSNTQVRGVVTAGFVYMTLILGYYSFMYESILDIYTYYWIPSVFTILLFMFLLIAGIGYKRVRAVLLWSLVAFLVLFNVVYASDRLSGFAFVYPDSERPLRHGVDFLNSSLDSGTIVGSWDAGYVGYYCDHTVVNLDGLVNNYEFQEILADQGLEAYLNMQNITCIANVDHFLGSREFLERMGGWTLVFEDSCPFPNPVSIFSVSSKGADYASRESRVFFVYSRDLQLEDI